MATGMRYPPTQEAKRTTSRFRGNRFMDSDANVFQEGYQAFSKEQKYTPGKQRLCYELNTWRKTLSLLWSYNVCRISLRASSPFNASVKTNLAQPNVMPRSGTGRGGLGTAGFDWCVRDIERSNLRVARKRSPGTRVRGELRAQSQVRLPLEIETLLPVHNISW